MGTETPNRDYKFTLNDVQIPWSKPVIKGTDLYDLAKVSTEGAVFLVVPGGKNRLGQTRRINRFDGTWDRAFHLGSQACHNFRDHRKRATAYCE